MHCILQNSHLFEKSVLSKKRTKRQADLERGSMGSTVKLSLKKNMELALAPGLRYRPMEPASLPMPATWSRELMPPCVQQAIKLEEIGARPSLDAIEVARCETKSKPPLGRCVNRVVYTVPARDIYGRGRLRPLPRLAQLACHQGV